MLASSDGGSWFWTGGTFQPGTDTVVEFFEKGDFTELYVYPAPGPRPVHMTVRIAHAKSAQGTFYAEALRGSSSVLDLSGYEIVRNDAHETTAARVVAGPPADQPALDKSLLNYDTNVNFRQVSWSAVKDQLGSVLQPQTPIVSTYDSDGRIVSTARADRTVLTYLPGSDRLDAVYDLAGYLLTDYVYDASGDLIEIKNEGQRRALDEALFDAKRQVSLRKTEALEDQAIESGMITQSFLDQVNVQRAQLEGQRSSVQNSLNDLENQKMKGSDAKKAKSQALDQLRGALRQIDQARNAFEENVARQLALLSGALNEKKLSIERDFSAAFARIESEFTKSFDAVVLEERRAVVIDVYRTVLGRDPSASETASGASQSVGVLKSTLLASPDRAARTARKDSILSGLQSKLDEFLSASDSSARAAYLNTLGLTAEEAVNLSAAEVTALKAFLASQSLHFAESAIDPLVELLKSEGVTITESDRTQLAVRLILIDILTGQIHPFLKEGEELLISLYALEKTSRLYAKHSSSFKLTYEDLQDFSLKNPSKHPVVHVEGKHYVNVLSVTPLEVTILDGGEVKKLSKEDFLKVWEGTTLLPDAHAPPALESKKLSEEKTRTIQGAFFFLIPAIIGAIGSIVGAVGGIIASIGSILAGIGTLIGNIVVGLGNILGGILHGIGTLTHTLFTGLKFAATHLFGGGLTGLFAPATQGGFFGASLNTLTAGSLFKSAVSIGLNYGLQKGLDALGVPVGISSVLTGFVTGGFLGGVSSQGFNGALFLQEGLRGAVQAGSRTLLAASGMNSTVTDVLNILTTTPTQGGSWQGTIGGQLITINASLALSLASYGIQKLGQTVGLDPRITGILGSTIAGGIGGAFQNGVNFGQQIIQSVQDGLIQGAIAYGVNFAVDQITDNALLQSLAARSIMGGIEGMLFRNNLFDGLFDAAKQSVVNFFGDVNPGSISLFSSVIDERGLTGALEAYATDIFDRGTIESVLRTGGFASALLSPKTNVILPTGVSAKEAVLSNGTGVLFDTAGGDVGRRRNNIVQLGEFGITYDGTFGLLEGSVYDTSSVNDLYSIDVLEGRAIKLTLQDSEGNEIIRVSEGQEPIFIKGPDNNPAQPIFNLWNAVVKAVSVGLSYVFKEGIAHAAEAVTNGSAQALQVIRYVFGNGFNNVVVPEYTNDKLIQPYIYNLALKDKIIELAQSLNIPMYETTNLFGNAIDWFDNFEEDLAEKSKIYKFLYDLGNSTQQFLNVLNGLTPQPSIPDALQPLVDKIQDWFNQLFGGVTSGFDNDLVNEVIRKVGELSHGRPIVDGIAFAHSGFFAPLIGAIEKAQYDISTVISYEGPFFRQDNYYINNPNIKRIISVWGTASNGIETGKYTNWLTEENFGRVDIDGTKKAVAVADFGPPTPEQPAHFDAPNYIETVNIKILGARHNDFTYIEYDSQGNEIWNRDPYEPERIAREINFKTNVFMRRLYRATTDEELHPGAIREFLENTPGISEDPVTGVWTVDARNLPYALEYEY